MEKKREKRVGDNKKKQYIFNDKSYYTSRPQGKCNRVGLRFL